MELWMPVMGALLLGAGLSTIVGSDNMRAIGGSLLLLFALLMLLGLVRLGVG